MNSKENLLSQPHKFPIAKKTNSLIESSDTVDSLYEQTKNEIVLKSIDDKKVIKSIDIIPNYEVDDYLSSSRVGSSVDPEINIEYGNTSLINKELEDGEQFEFYNSLREKEKMQLSNRTIRTNEDIHQLIQIVTEPYLYIDSSIVEAQSNNVIKNEISIQIVRLL